MLKFEVTKHDRRSTFSQKNMSIKSEYKDEQMKIDKLFNDKSNDEDESRKFSKDSFKTENCFNEENDETS